MKNVKSLLAIASLAAGLFIMNACTEPCKDRTCANGGVFVTKETVSVQQEMKELIVQLK
jgi:hypothetical protein